MAPTAKLLLLLPFMMMHIVPARSALRYCTHGHYNSKEQNKCVPCTDRCLPDQGLSVNCGYDEYGEKIGASCVRCSVGFYSKLDVDRKRYCTYCTDCSSLNRGYKTMCRADSNAVCTDCPRGYYGKHDDRCSRCSQCCPNVAKMHRVEKCEQDGMGPDCSCRNIYNHCSSGTCEIPTKLKTPRRNENVSTSTPSKPTTKIFKESSSSSNSKTNFNSTSRTSGTKLKTEAVTLSLTKRSKLKSTVVSATSNLRNITSKWSMVKFKQDTKMHESKVNKPYPYQKNEGNISKENSPSPPTQKVILYAMTSIAVVMFSVLIFIFVRRARKRRSKMFMTETDECLVSSATPVNDEVDERDPFDKLPEMSRHVLLPSRSVSETTTITYIDDNATHEQTESYFEDQTYNPGIKELVTTAEPFKAGSDDDCTEDACNYADSFFLSSSNTEEDEKQSQEKKENLNQPIQETSQEDTSTLKKTRSQVRYQRQRSMPARNVLHLEELNNQLKTDRCAKMIGDLKTCVKRELERYLDTESSGVANWKEVAVYFGVNERLIDVWEAKFQSGCSPTGTVLRFMISKQRKVQDLVTCLGRIERLDAKHAFLSHLKDGCLICNATMEETSEM